MLDFRVQFALCCTAVPLESKQTLDFRIKTKTNITIGSVYVYILIKTFTLFL